MNSSSTIKFGVKFREAMGFVTETGSLGKVTGGMVVLMLLSKIFYYMELGRFIQTILSYSPEAFFNALLSPGSIANIFNSSDLLKLNISQMINIHLGFVLVGVYAVFYLYLKRHPESTLPKASAGYYAYMVFGILMTTILFWLGYYLSSMVPFLMLLLWPLMVYTYCSRAEFGGSALMAMTRALEDMRGYIWKSVGYTALLMLIFYGFAFVLSVLFIALLPAQAIKLSVVVFLLSDLLFTLVLTRMFVAIYVDNVEKPIATEEEE